MFGLVHVDVARLKQQLLAPASRVLDGMTSLLQGAFQRHCELVAEDLQTDARWLAQKPSELVEFAAFVREARTHLPAGARATQAEADQHTTIKFSELLGPSGMAAAANPIAVTRRASQDDEDGYNNYRRNSYSDELDEVLETRALARVWTFDACGESSLRESRLRKCRFRKCRSFVPGGLCLGVCAALPWYWAQKCSVPSCGMAGTWKNHKMITTHSRSLLLTTARTWACVLCTLAYTAKRLRYHT